MKFRKLLNQYRHNQLPPKEKKQVDEWLDSLATNEQEKAVRWDETRQQETLQKIKDRLNNPFAAKPMEHPTTRRKHRIIAATAACLAFIVVTWFAIPQVFSPVREIAEFTKPGLNKTTLNDGTLVWLTTGSKLSYQESADGSQRLATLVGEALFEVAKDPSRPFSIQCGEVAVQVVGTSFSLRSDTAGVSLKVLTGKVNMVTPDNKTGIEVQPNEQVTYHTQGQTIKTVLTSSEVNSISGWVEYTMNFTNTSMRQVVARIEKKFDVRVKVSDKRVFECSITADFTDKSLHETLSMLTEMLDIEYAREAATVMITGPGCSVHDQ